MSSLTVSNKKLIKEYYDKIYGATPENIGELLSPYFSKDTIFDCSHPINNITGFDNMIEQFWKPFMRSFPDAVKRPYIFTGGQSIRGDEDPKFENAHWVVSNGYYEATFAEDFLDIPASKGIVFLRFCECSMIEDGKIVLTRLLIDLLDLMRQVGIIFFNALGNDSFIPGPYSFDGIKLGEGDPETSLASIQLIEDMCFKGLNSFEEGGYEGMGLSRYFKEDFTWYGPCGIGICKGLKGFEDNHQIPWLNSFPDRENANFFASIGDDNYAFVGGWPSMYATHKGSDFLGIPATGVKLDMRCIDWWRVEDGKIVENWVNLDIIHILYQMGYDVFDRIRKGRYYFNRR
ncbi:MAG: ester cyclase [Clostridium sp.]